MVSLLNYLFEYQLAANLFLKRIFMFTLYDLTAASIKPKLYSIGAELWNDPHISTEMLKFHLSPDTDAASYRPEKISAICSYIPEYLGLRKGSAIVDLGCGPGLYCNLLSKADYNVRGIDRSDNSIRYAKEHSEGAVYTKMSYLEPFGDNEYDLALMVSKDYGVLKPDDRRLLLKNIHTSLKEKGFFAFDIPSFTAYESELRDSKPVWYASASGFYRPHENFVLENRFFYPEAYVHCDKIAVFDSVVSTYIIWQHYFSVEAITRELEENGFKIKAVMASLWGDEFSPESDTIALICQKQILA